jgi:MoaA/NifB/PqqE/SkfB family radical SAM enzyme
MIHSIYQNTRTVELEITTYCNAACPQCPRNIYGGATIDGLPLISWTLSQLQSILDQKFIKQLDLIYFCGTYGDPMMNKELVSMCQWIKSVNPNINIGIHTNGGVGKLDTYRQLASLVKFIAFGIDGLADTNHLYRRNTKWQAIMENAQEFISAGGRAMWDFIVFEHNQHQVESAQQLSQQLGFAEFNVKKTGRFFNKNHQLVDKIDVQDNLGCTEYEIRPPSDSRYLNQSYDTIKHTNIDEYVKTTAIDCYWLKKHIIYIGAEGYVFPCGFLHDRLYGVEAQQNPDYAKIFKMMDDIGGSKMANAFHTKLEHIVDGAWFQKIQKSWNGDRLERCAMMCGEKIHIIGEQNVNITYKNVKTQPA